MLHGKLTWSSLLTYFEAILTVYLFTFNHYAHHTSKHFGVVRHERGSRDLVDPMNLCTTILFQNCSQDLGYCAGT